MPDDDPEVDEELTVTLTGVTPPDWQKLKAGASQLKVVIKENDNPRGVFEFADVMQDVYTQHVRMMLHVYQ